MHDLCPNCIDIWHSYHVGEAQARAYVERYRRENQCYEGAVYPHRNESDREGFVLVLMRDSGGRRGDFDGLFNEGQIPLRPGDVQTMGGEAARRGCNAGSSRKDASYGHTAEMIEEFNDSLVDNMLTSIQGSFCGYNRAPEVQGGRT
ncbi:hypothetical protein ACMFMG_007509 [Clarireedia jacksonii]